MKLETYITPMGWAIIAVHEGERYVVEAGLETFTHRLQYWQDRQAVILSSIERQHPKPQKEKR